MYESAASCHCSATRCVNCSTCTSLTICAVSPLHLRADSAPRTPRERDDSRSIFIKGFDKYQGEQDVRAAVTELFSSCGEVVHVRLPTDRETGELKGFGFVEFSDPGAKDKAGELDGTEAAGGWLKVDTNPGGGGGGGGGGFSGGRGGGFSGGRGGGRFSGGECPPACSCSSS